MKSKLILTMLALGIFIFSCEDQGMTDLEELQNLETVANLDLGAEEAMNAGFDEVDLLAEQGMGLLERELSHHLRGPGKSGPKGQGPKGPGPLDCAVVEKDTVNQTITIDFGEGCEDPRGMIRSGKIIIEYSGRMFEVGAYRTVTLDNFYLDTLQLEGSKRIEVLTADSTEHTMQSTLSDGRVTYPDGTYSTRVSDHTKTMVHGEDIGEGQTTIAGSASGVKRDGESYSVTILEELLILRACKAEHVMIPVSGQKQIIAGDSEALIDFGDGNCDNEIEVTIDGITETIVVEPKMKRGGPGKGPKGDKPPRK